MFVSSVRSIQASEYNTWCIAKDLVAWNGPARFFFTCRHGFPFCRRNDADNNLTRRRNDEVLRLANHLHCGDQERLEAEGEHDVLNAEVVIVAPTVREARQV